MNFYAELVEKNLLYIIDELAGQAAVRSEFSHDEMTLCDQIKQMTEWVEDAGEYGLAYENIVCLLEECSFFLRGLSAVKLLELGLIFGFKTDMDKDRIFDRRGAV
ncbi:hypothetical protein [Xanthomonas bromi]|uniref:Uncharacterized protein n=1 Tax=Xanthomonas bromi TaxID=56449 RepID=A0ABX5BNB9_9XANT|nr:hypothetical protein [Xanthomonas bromi]PPV06216.1 hypothetical protein XbrCFBP1976_13560 [Xanthomonas bromi]